MMADGAIDFRTAVLPCPEDFPVGNGLIRCREFEVGVVDQLIGWLLRKTSRAGGQITDSPVEFNSDCVGYINLCRLDADAWFREVGRDQAERFHGDVPQASARSVGEWPRIGRATADRCHLAVGWHVERYDGRRLPG